MSTLTPAEATAEILAATAVNLKVACTAMGINPATGSRLLAKGEFPVPVIRMGARVVVPTTPLREILHLDRTGGPA